MLCLARKESPWRSQWAGQAASISMSQPCIKNKVAARIRGKLLLCLTAARYTSTRSQKGYSLHSTCHIGGVAHLRLSVPLCWDQLQEMGGGDGLCPRMRPSLANTAETWCSTVLGEVKSRPAISVLDKPSAISRRTSSWRVVRPA